MGTVLASGEALEVRMWDDAPVDGSLPEPAWLAPLAQLLGRAGGPGAARALRDRFGSLAALRGAPPGALARVRGVGPEGERRLRAALELAWAEEQRPPPRVLGPEDALAVLRPLLQGLERERLVGLYLGARGQVLARRVLSEGSPTATVVDVACALRPAVQLGAPGVILGHNHPSGDPSPSAQDVEVTLRLAQGAQVLGLRLFDHLILGGAQWVSLAQRGLLAGWPGRLSPGAPRAAGVVAAPGSFDAGETRASI